MTDQIDWRLPVPTYKAVHFRLGRDRGPARNHLCGCGKQAEHWAYQHTGEMITDESGKTYSADLKDYSPMCRSCHFSMDMESSERRAASMAKAQETSHTPEAILKMRQGLTGQTRSPEAIENYKNAWTPERRAAHGEKVRAAQRRKASV